MSSTVHNLPTSPLITVHEAAGLCGVSERHITRMCTLGEIKAVKLGRIWRINRESLFSLLGLD